MLIPVTASKTALKTKIKNVCVITYLLAPKYFDHHKTGDLLTQV